MHHATGPASFYGLDLTTAAETLAHVHSVLATWREKAMRPELSPADVALLEAVLDQR